MIEQRRSLRNPSNSIAIMALEVVQQGFGDEWNKYISVTNWVPVNDYYDGFNYGIEIESILKPLEDEYLVVPVINGSIPIGYAFDLDLINRAIEIMNQIDTDYEIKAHPDREMPIVFQSPESLAPVIMIAPRVWN